MPTTRRHRTASFAGVNTRVTAALAIALAIPAILIAAEDNQYRATSRIEYHGGKVMTMAPSLYAVFYGGWDFDTTDPANPGADVRAASILIDAMTSLNGSEYMRTNTTYPDAAGNVATGYTIYSGNVTDRSYAHGMNLRDEDVRGILADQFARFTLPLDPNGIYLVIAASDIASDATGLCSPGAPPHHGLGVYNGTGFTYALIGHPARCPRTVGGPFVGRRGALLPTPNGDFAADVLVSTYAAVLSAALTDPDHATGWYDRSRLENSAKCGGSYGRTYRTANGALANVRAMGHDYLIQENWVNVGRGYCSLFVRP